MDNTLKELLKEEKRRTSDKSERSERKDRHDRSDKSTRPDRTDRTDRGERKHRNEDEKKRQERRAKKRQERRAKREKAKQEGKLELVEESDTSSSSEDEQVPTQVAQTQVAQVQPVVDDGTDKFLFVYEDKTDKIYADLNKVPKGEGDTVKIFPVFFTGCNENLNEEIVVCKSGNWTPQEENKDSSWLSIINKNGQKLDGREIKVLPFEPDQIAVYNGSFFHCVDDIQDYLELYGPDVMDVTK
jgi:hypothetical protein